MPICRLQKNHALSRRGGPTPALSPHPSPTPNDASKAKQRKVYIPEERTLSRFSLFLSLFPFFPPLSLSPFLSLFLHVDGTPSLSRYFFRPPRTHQLVLTVSIARSLPTPAPCPTYILSLPLSVSLSYLPTTSSSSLSFHSFSLSAARLARSLTCAQMKSIKMLGATSRQSCSTPTPSFPFIPLVPPYPGRPPLQPPPNSHSFAVRNRENPYVRSRYLPPAPAPQVSQTPVYHRRTVVWVGCKVRTRQCIYGGVPVCAYVRVTRTRMRDYRVCRSRLHTLVKHGCVRVLHMRTSPHFMALP